MSDLPNLPKWYTHPAADLFPMMSDAELDELGKDIAANGLTSPIVRYGDLDNPMVLDGRNRLAALQRIGGDPEAAIRAGHLLDDAIDPYAYVVSANLRRRHLNAEQKRELAARMLKATPEKSDSQIAKVAHVSDKTVTSVRSKLEATSEIPKLDKRKGADGKERKQPAPRHAAKARPVVVSKIDPTESELKPTLEELANRIRESFPADRADYAVLGRRMVDEPGTALVVAWERTAEAERRVFLKHAGLVPQSQLDTAIARAEAAEKEVEGLGEKPMAPSEPAENSSAPAPSAALGEGLPAAYAALSGHNQSDMRRWVREGCPPQWKHFEAYEALRQDCTNFIAAAETTSPEGRQVWLAEVSPDWEKPQEAAVSRKWPSSQSRMMAAIRNRL